MRPVCVSCGVEMTHPISGVVLVKYDDEEPKYIFLADLKVCPKCGYEILDGFGRRIDYYPNKEKVESIIENAESRGRLYVLK